MEVFITHESALEFWRRQRRSKVACRYRPSLRKPSNESPPISGLRQKEAWGLSLPLDVMVSSLEARRSSKAVRPHVCSKALPDACFLNAGGGLYVSSPEFCFFQMAHVYPLAKLIELGLELCGSYSLSSKAREGAAEGAIEQALYNLPKLTSANKLKAFCARLEEWPGHRKAMNALRYIVDGSASPMESILAILLTLPYRYGGYGFPMPELNGRIDPIKGMKPFSGRGFYRGDLVWREARVVAEYNSDLEHADPRSMAQDAIRRSDLALCGFTEVTVTKEQLKSMMLLDKVARQIAKKLRKQLRYENPGFFKACRKLRSMLL